MFCLCSAMLWAGRQGIHYSIDTASKLNKKCFYSNLFMESVFTTAEKISLNRMAILCGLDSNFDARIMCTFQKA